MISLSRDKLYDSWLMKTWFPNWDVREMYSKVSRYDWLTRVYQTNGIKNERFTRFQESARKELACLEIQKTGVRIIVDTPRWTKVHNWG